MKKNALTDILIFVVGCELVGAVSALASGGDFSGFYNSIERPPFSPPGWLFPIVWAILYALMGISAYIISETEHKHKKNALGVFAAQLFVNAVWSPVFFGLKSFLGALIIAVILLIMVALMVKVFLDIDSRAGIMNVPYLLWSAFALYLTAGVYFLNT